MIKEPQPIATAMREHLTFMATVRNLAKGTVASYKSTYTTLSNHLEPQLGRPVLTTDLADPDLIKDYFVYHVSVHCNEGTYEIKVSHVRTIIKWLMDHRYLAWGPNPVDLLGIRKSDYRPARRHLKDKELLSVLTVAGRRHPRDRYLLLAARVLPRRINELLALKWGDVDWDSEDITYDNRKARRFGLKMPLDAEARAVLTAWREEYEKEVGQPVRANWHIFPAFYVGGRVDKGRKHVLRLSPSSIISNPSKLLREHLKDAGVYEERMGWHSLRRTSGNAVRQTARESGRADSMDLAKEALSHKSTLITGAYMNVDEEYETYKDWRMGARLVGPEIAAQIPELAALSIPAAEPQETTSDALASPQDGAQVIDLSTRRKRAG